MGSGGEEEPSVPMADVPLPSAPREDSLVGSVAGSGEGHGDWRLKGFNAPNGANLLCVGGGLSRGVGDVKESTHGSAQAACAGCVLDGLSAWTVETGSGPVGLGAGQSAQEHG